MIINKFCSVEELKITKIKTVHYNGFNEAEQLVVIGFPKVLIKLNANFYIMNSVHLREEAA